MKRHIKIFLIKKRTVETITSITTEVVTILEFLD